MALGRDRSRFLSNQQLRFISTLQKCHFSSQWQLHARGAQEAFLETVTDVQGMLEYFLSLKHLFPFLETAKSSLPAMIYT